MSRLKGNIAEEKGCVFLISKGFEIIERNFYAKKMGEIDIIAIKNGVLHFVEVKSGNTFEPIYNITKIKLSRITKSAYLYLKAKNIDMPFCIDALILSDNEFEFIENITF